jgi:PAS domain S-box-containing protein
MAHSNLQLRMPDSPLLRYGFAITSFGVALGLALLADHYGFRSGQMALFVLGLAVTAYYAGSGPAAVTLLLSIIFFDYFFVEPRYNLFVRVSDLPYFAVFIGFAALTASFGAGRRRVERELIRTRDDLQIEVAERTQQASLLNLTHDSIFVRDMNDVITNWNRGAQELYRWNYDEAIGKRSHDLLRTVFPAPIEDIDAELLRTGRWEGELRHTTADGTELVVLSRWSLRRDPQERAVAILETNNNITDRKRREEEVLRLNQELTKRSRELERSSQELAERSRELERATRNSKHLPTQFHTTCARLSGTCLAIPSCFKKEWRRCWTKRANGT